MEVHTPKSISYPPVQTLIFDNGRASRLSYCIIVEGKIERQGRIGPAFDFKGSPMCSFMVPIREVDVGEESGPYS